MNYRAVVHYTVPTELISGLTGHDEIEVFVEAWEEGQPNIAFRTPNGVWGPPTASDWVEGSELVVGGPDGPRRQRGDVVRVAAEVVSDLKGVFKLTNDEVDALRNAIASEIVIHEDVIRRLPMKSKGLRPIAMAFLTNLASAAAKLDLETDD